MKISASIYSDKKRPLKEVIEDLKQHQIELLHVDCNDDISVFEDIKMIRQWCDLPIDLHIITEEPSKYYTLLEENPVEYLTFQFEDLKQPLEIPDCIQGKKGLAIVTPTDINVFTAYQEFDFILIMATIPGQSGGKFDTYNFSKIRNFRKLYPGKSIHVDGGVNAEVSFILRNMGVSSSVSGSYLFNAPSIGHALMNLTKREVESEFEVKDFMIPLSESPVVSESELTLEKVLLSIEKGNLGFCLVVDEEQNFKGLISNADVRKGLLSSISDLNQINVEEIINRNPKYILENETVFDLLKLIKSCSFPIMYLPVLKIDGKASGIVTFVNLIKSEL
ncbi:MAG: CBS domain-containing protein [Flavobacteriia bacterium]|nr:CBS domain-containing protein [Flavobacteriia bacterium]